MTESKRKNIVKIRINNEEKDRLNDLKTRSHLAAWMRETCLDQHPKKQIFKVPKCDPDLLRQIAGIGNNLNQIARTFHLKMECSPAEKVAITSRLFAAIEDLAELKRGQNDR